MPDDDRPIRYAGFEALMETLMETFEAPVAGVKFIEPWTISDPNA